MKASIMIVVLLCALQGVINVIALKKERDALKTELASSKEELTLAKSKLASMETANIAIREQAQACLDRQSKNLMEAENWLQIIERSSARDMEDKEKRKVPDDETRRNLLDSLDQPL